MSIQRNVQKQAEERKAAIRKAISFGKNYPQWLCSVLQEHSLSPLTGSLVQYVVVDEQEGDLHTGIWLTNSLEFWEFEVMLSRKEGKILSIEQFENATVSFPANASQPGVGPSFGFLAIQVLHETLAV